MPQNLSQEGKLKKEDYVKLVDWKLTRGKWRPRLLDFAKTCENEAIEDASKKAFEVLDQSIKTSKDNMSSIIAFQQALDVLCELKGLGPATASAILSAYDESIPFMSDEALSAVMGSKEYTKKAAVALITSVRRKSKELSKASGKAWSSRDIEKCLFITASKQSDKTLPSRTKKRKR